MENQQSYNSLRSRERAILGTVSFLPPVVPADNARISSHGSDRGSNRKERVLHAQRRHQKRTKDYMDALEAEITRLRAEATQVNEIASNWKRCALALAGPAFASAVEDCGIAQLEPGLFIWFIPSNPLGSGRRSEWHAYQLIIPADICPSPTPSPLERYSSLEHALLHNFCQHIIPTLELTDTATRGYAEHVIPLALSSRLVLNSLLAASASYIEIARSGRSSIGRLRYKSSAIKELRQISTHGQTDLTTHLIALTAILGLLIEDMISSNRDFPVLLKLAQFWISTSSRTVDLENKTTRLFLVEQIQLMKRLVHPLYQFGVPRGDESQQLSSMSSLATIDSARLEEIFSSLESAVAQACRIHTLTSTGQNMGQTATPEVLDPLLARLKVTISKIPPFTPGENSLVWTLFVAAAKSTKPEHTAFFTSRLAELLRRTGYENMEESPTSISMGIFIQNT
ncbi:conserved hypothetical protein [Paecilomyces variotii No. 5]|uniref:BZIP domain-containing protein n=1 Tax=Byssochlamys spectabilis (strain No. 5 / NBRC 109023) TaxID=1356009 RepID=V5F6W7_BYSSN|nr:conserved hypothetical protein [Paecilomyces variotii No. 5]